MKFNIRRTPSVFAISLAVCAMVLTNCGNQGGNNEFNGNKKDSTQVPVEVASVSQASVSAYYTGTTTLESENEADVRAKVGGVLVKLFVEEGDYVREGQVIAKLDDEQLRIQMQQAEATLNKLKRDFDRNKELHDKKLISREAFDASRYDYESQEAAYNLAKLNLDFTDVRATIDGVISQRFVKAGNTITIADPLFHISDFDPLMAIVHIPEHESYKIKKGQTTLVKLDAVPNQVYKGNILRISPVVDPLTGTFKVTVQVPDRSGTIKPGMFGRLNIVYDTHDEALTVPQNALVREDEEIAVFVIRDDTAHRQPVQIGFSDEGVVEIVSGLQLGDTIVTTGQGSLKDSALVDIVNAATAQL